MPYKTHITIMRSKKHKLPNVYGFSRELYEEALQFAKKKALTDPDFEKAWNSSYSKKRISRGSDPPNKGQKKLGSASVVVMDSRGMYLNVIEKRQNQLPFGIPGGKREPGEFILDTVVREFWEETGCYVHGHVLDIYFSPKNKDMIIFVYVYDWSKDLVFCKADGVESSTIYMTLLSLQTTLDATQLGEELYFTLDDNNRLIYRDPLKVRNLEQKRQKKLTIIQEPLFMADDLSVIRANGIRIRQAHRNDLNDSRILEIFLDYLRQTNMGLPPPSDSETSME